MYSIGIDLGGTTTKLVLLSSSGHILHKERTNAVPAQSLAVVFEGLARRVRSLVARQRLPYPPPGGVGVGIAGIVDHGRGWLKLSGALRLGDCDLRGAAEAAFRCPVVVECDSNAGALADLYWGRAREAESVLYISWGTGISLGLALHRRLYRSAGHSMGEFGHMRVIGNSHRPCYCGCNGCLEVEAGGRAIEQTVSRHFGRPIELKEIASSASLGDTFCQGRLEHAARLVARALGSVLVVLNPDCVILGGGVSNCFSLMRPVFEQELGRNAPAFARENLTVAVSAFPDDAGVIGAAMLPRHENEQENSHYADAGNNRA